MRIGVMSDIHGNLIALERVQLALQSQSPDLVVNLGDVVSSPLWPRETLALLRTLDHPTIRGNHDRWVATLPREQQTPTNQFVHDALTAADRSWLGALPAQLALGEGVLAVHGTPTSDTAYLLEDAVDGRLARTTSARLGERLAGVTAELVLCGHSHTQHVAMSGDGILVVNPGSVGCPRTVDQREPAELEACSPHARYAVATRSRHGWQVELFAVAYDWSHVVRRAVSNGRSDWGRAFLGTGVRA